MTRLPPDRTRGPDRSLSEAAAQLARRSAEVDRAARFDQRLELVEQRRARQRRSERRAQTVVLVLTSLVVAAIGRNLFGTAGIALGLLAAPVVLGTEAGLRRAAARRGASAWDWTTGRYRMLGSPASRVQKQDTPAGADTTSFFE